ncbi:putative hybrid nrps pks [Venustampulla echinocandica]|uniref:Putative hybrid nrps pks n=1 Tax=Venustampulla echinocandica TaxID=2656787 RepID=A0A370TEZ4_9HELO|nr:putative hybrid nrps pks [Venustampulla echinocandica]RDL33251.1 putative hybrid nrps pks [Venustampulla echinocandica]
MDPKEPIAIIGTGCRFPGDCDNPSKLWELLREPQDLLKEIPEERFNVDTFYHPKNYHHGSSNVRHSYLLNEDLRYFDAQFFGIKPIEANSIDPQQRLLLETVYESLEAAGLSINQMRGSTTATYVGVMSADFTDMISRDIDMFPTYFATGTARSILSNRLSYFFDWHGPSMTIDTACSSSLVAMHQAVQTLRAGDSSIAVVAGSNLVLGPEQYIAESKLQMLSPTGRSRMWDADADGYGRGEGIAAIVLKRLSQALADGDHIECIIRETGLNQDGRTRGITMPSASAQAALIQSTYARAGLDLSKRADRPQYFEAHGTGTPAGDPIEAEAISDAFFGPGSNFTPSGPEDTLFVGSIKTIIGHTEGTAGLAAVIKASLAVQGRTVPPNRLLSRLNPSVAPFYRNLKILSAAQKWPTIAKGAVRRVSVNSFGFGGANAHAILESFDEPIGNELLTQHDKFHTCFTPFLFSAASDSALISGLERYRETLATTKTKNGEFQFTPRDLSWTLSSRRSTLESRTILPAVSNFEDLVANLDTTIKNLSESPPSPSSRTDSSGKKLRILGIFTGQGAQWARMGAELLEKSPAARSIISKLDQSLNSLPSQDRPQWLLRDQILADAESSQVSTASISQPICTAIQIMLIDLLRVAGIELSAVVGHSSGEIGAAYAAQYLTAEEAIRVAYYRGLHLRSVSHKEGAMMAVGTSFEDATELCELPAFEGRVCVAASNSPASVTLSGDADAIEEIKVVLAEEKKFARLLKVDRAYHSHHMQPCAEAYVRSLQQCHVTSKRRTNCRWVSSVFVQDITDMPEDESLSGTYWASNLTRPVMFAEALRKTLEDPENGTPTPQYDLIIEVGPHPALKNPVSQTIQDYLGQSVPYIGTLSRGVNSIEAFSTALGNIWELFGEGVVDFTTFDRLVSGGRIPKPKLCKGLPSYQWDHNRAFWYESRLSRAFRTRKDSPNELLGRDVSDGAPDQLRWHNVLKRSEIEWLDGHQVQGQTVFPCAGYVSACIEAAMRLPGMKQQQPQEQQQQRTILAIELLDVIIGQAVVFGDDQDTGIETFVTLTNIAWQEKDSDGNRIISANFSFYSSPNSETLEMTSHATCQVRVTVGEERPGCSDTNMPPRKPHEDDFAMLEVESDRFYDALGKLGFGYSGPFRALSGMKRKLGAASGFIRNSPSSSSPPLLIQPAALDAAIQSIMLAYCYPGDSMLRSIYLPTGIKRLLVNPQHCLSFTGADIDVPFDAMASINTSRSLSGDVSIYSPDGSLKAIQLEGLQTRPLSNSTESSDLNIFTEMVWEVGNPDGELIVAKTNVPELEPDLLFSLERVAYFYLRSLDKQFTAKDRARMKLEWHQERFFAYIDHCLTRVARGSHPFVKPEWIHDSENIISDILKKYPENIDLRLMCAVGENMAAVIRGQTTMLEHMIKDNMLNDFYVVAHGMPRYTKYLASIARQISHRYPHMSVLEIGAGTGGATKSFLNELSGSFSTYTFTDISSGFFPKAEQVFSSYSSRMNFKVLDIEKDVQEQGFSDGSFDVVIASLVLHATRNLADTLKNVRRLLKPGGYLLLLEITENEQMRFGLIFGGLPGWWLGHEDGRALSPCIGLKEWDLYLKQTGFSGMDTAIPHHDKLPVPLSIIVSQAVDDRVQFLKHPISSPLSSIQSSPVIPRLTLIGGGGVKSAKIAADISRILGHGGPHCGQMRFIKSLQDIRPHQDLPIGGTTLCLADIDEPVFKSINAEKLRGFQEIFKQSANVLWITRGSRSGDPFSRMVIGFGRTLVLEMLHIRLQFLDISPSSAADIDIVMPDPTSITEYLLRSEAAGTWENEGGAQSEREPLLYSNEPELHFDQESGKLYVPRFKLNKSQNDRYNSGRRTITDLVDTKETIVQLAHRNDGLCNLFIEDPSSSSPVSDSLLNTTTQMVEIDVLYSVTRAIKVRRDFFLFPVLGVDRRTGERILALSLKEASRINVMACFVLPGVAAPEAPDGAVEALQLLYTELLAQSAMRDVLIDSQVILLQPDPAFARAVSRLATDKGAKLACLMTTKRQHPGSTEPGLAWSYIHSNASKLELQQSVPNLFMASATNSPWLILNMGGATTKGLCRNLVECLPPGVAAHVSSEATLTSQTVILPPRLDQHWQDVRSILVNAKYGMEARDGGKEDQKRLAVVTANDLVNQQLPHGLRDEPHVVAWHNLGNVPIQITPVDSHVKFRNDKTYWLVGLTGGLGLSLCEWMAQRGARYLVVSSRSPKVDERWLKKMKGLQVTVQVIANDICDRDSVRAVYDEICRKLPPVAGVAQGAMVLHDTMFLDLDMERVNKVMRPKVDGSMYLEEIFKDTDLEFFIFFSSMAAVTGNPGQSAYAAANMFMAGLASQRRKRGLNASAVHIGAIFGNGYVTRELTLAQQEFLGKVGNLWLSEQDFRQLFAEAVLAGQDRRNKNPELSTGLKMIDGSQESEDTITWFRNPIFQHCVRSESQDAEWSNSADGSRDRRGVAIKAQLLDAINQEEVHQVMLDAFTAKLRSSLQVEEGRNLLNLTADNLGIDSLVAVDIRSWFIKELQVEIPVLKIISGTTMGELLVCAQELLPAALTPNLDPNNKDKPRIREPKKLGTKPKSATNLISTSETSPAKQQGQPTRENLAEEINSRASTTGVKGPQWQAQAQLRSSAKPVSAGPAESGIGRDEHSENEGDERTDLTLITPTSSSESASISNSSPLKFLALSFDEVQRPGTENSTPGTSSNTWSEIDGYEVLSQNSSFGPSSKKVPKEPKSTNMLRKVVASSTAVTKKVLISFAQSRFWFLEQYLQDASTAFNITLSISLNGSLDVGKFERAVKLVGQRHEALRTRFIAANNDGTAEAQDVMQEVLAVPTLELELQDIGSDTQADEVYKEIRRHRYKLSEGENMRILLLRRSLASFQLIIGYHHINMDGVSLEVILRELEMAYNSKTRLSSVQNVLQYPDFAEQQRHEYESGQWTDDLAFWRNEFGDISSTILEPLPLLPMAKTSRRSPLTVYSTSTADFHVNQSILQNIESTCKRLKVTAFHFHLAVFYTLLIRLVDVEHLCIGISSANRGHGADKLQSVGMYLNLLPLLLRAQPNQTFANVLRMVREKSQTALAHSKVPFDVIVSELGLPRSTTHSPLFQVLFNYRPGVSERRSFCNCDSEVVAFEQGQTAYDLTLDIIGNPGGDCHVILAGQSALYNAHHMGMLRNMYKQLLGSFARNPALRPSMESLYDAEEARSAIQLGRGPFYKYLWPETLPHRIDMMVQKYNNKIALVDASKGPKSSSSLSYAQMANRVNSIATALNKQQPPIGHGSIVGVFLEPGLNWICSLLAVLRLDATYMPLDSRTGLDRLSAIVQDCKPTLLLVDDSTEEESEYFDSVQTKINIDRYATTTATTLIPNTAKANSVAAILHTSGSTGIPKGIIMRHETFANSIEIMTDKLHFREGGDVTLQQSSYSFDMSLCQTFLTLSNGGTLHVVPKQLRGDPLAISSIIATQGITFTTATPAEYISWIRYGKSVDLGKSSWRLAQTGGEPVSKALKDAFREVSNSGLHLVDCYGPTEITFCCSSRDVDYWAEVPNEDGTDNATGLQTWPNNSVYIVDTNMKAVPVGIPGQVLIGGAGVVAGYLHSELDARGFATDTFAPTDFLAAGWSRLHHTGDFGRLSKVDGSLILQGRIAGDTQVKLRGLRIDLREVEAAIINAAEGKIVDVAVTVRESTTSGSELLIAFAVTTSTNSNGKADDELSRVLNRLPLPLYMRPAAIIRLANLPINTSNKIDRAALKLIPLPEGRYNSDDATTSLGPQLNDTESRLKELWEDLISSEVLSQYKIAPESDFFHVGGSSMILVKLRARIQKAFGIGSHQLSLFQLFESSTLGGMATLVIDSSSPKNPSQSHNNSRRTVPDEEEKAIDWEVETAISPSLMRNPLSKQHFFTQPDVIVLTGATGFLGRAILTRLLEDGIVSKIHCLAVRDPKGICERYPALFRSPQVVVHAGDLALPRFGLADEQQLSDIFSEAHAVIHNGADVSFMKSYTSLKPANLEATKELVRLCLPYQLSFHYISSAAVTHLTGEESFEQRSVGSYSPPSSSELLNGNSGYLATKWASERYLEKISDRCELPIWIHRPSSITGDGASEVDLMTNLLHYSRTIKAVPDTSLWRGYIDLVSVGRVAMDIANQVYEDYSWPGNVKYLYESGEQEILLSDIRGVLERATGGSKIETVRMEEWVSRAEEKGLNPLLGEYLRHIDGTPFVFPRLVHEGDFF